MMFTGAHARKRSSSASGSHASGSHAASSASTSTSGYGSGYGTGHGHGAGYVPQRYGSYCHGKQPLLHEYRSSYRPSPGASYQEVRRRGGVHG